MEAKQKAVELVEKYYKLKWQHYTSTRNSKIIGMSKQASKQCAIIALDTALEFIDLTNHSDRNYIEQVKAEIEQL
jgi:hypothetical protein